MQKFALQILILLDKTEKEREKELRLYGDIRKRFPQFFEDEPEIVEDDSAGEHFYNPEMAQDLRGVTWESPADMAQQEREALARILGDSSILVSGLEEPESTEGMSDLGPVFEPDNGEWI